MIVTVLWEDQRGDRRNGFAPGALVNACVKDRLAMVAQPIRARIEHVPKKGNGNVLKALKNDFSSLRNDGRVIAVCDRDKFHLLWRDHYEPPHNCMQGLTERVASDCGGPRELVFLRQNMETLLEHCRAALGILTEAAARKPSPEDRDELIERVLRDRQARAYILAHFADFRRLVDRIAAVLTPAPELR